MMFTWRQVLRVAQTIAVPVILSIAASYFFPPGKEQPPPPSLYIPVLKSIDFLPRSYPVTYKSESSDFVHYSRVQNVTTGTPDTTAVILNWARFPNVLLITSLLCGPWLDDTIAEIIIWNNNPAMLSYDDLKNTGCRKNKLKIHNARMNMYFQARFLACAAAKTPYCFTQDDDYLIRPEIIQALRSRLAAYDHPHVIHLLPPHEHLSSSLREIHVPKPNPSYISDIHTSFAWLGHGTIMHRSKAEEFVGLMATLNASNEEIRMMDNYFSLLSNRVPEIWFDQDFPLGHENAFTVGQEGHRRNVKHILRAAEYLDSIAHCGAASCDTGGDAVAHRNSRPPFTSLGGQTPPMELFRAACSSTSCVLETNIRLLPGTIAHTSDKIANIIDLEEYNLNILGESGRKRYEEYPLSRAVDARPNTAFKSPYHARKGDTITLDVLADISNKYAWQTVEMVWLVNPATEKILRAVTFESSTDGKLWHGAIQQIACDDSKIEDPDTSAANNARKLRECSVQMVSTSNAFHLRASGRYFKAQLVYDVEAPWTVYEMWLRGL